mgnify:CR=1 FL=1
MLSNPPYALTPVVFRFRALTTLAGRLPLGGERELAMAVLMGARLADGCTTRESLSPELRKVRGQGARHWLGTLTLPTTARTAAQLVADASGGESREGVATALDRLVTLAAQVLDAPSRAELKQLLALLRAQKAACQSWLEHDPPNIERALRALQRMTGDVHRASEVVARIRRDARNAAPQRERLDLADVIGEVLELAGGELARNEVVVSTRIQERVPAVLGDRVQLGQVLVNLVLNAIEAMQLTPAGARHLTLRLSCQEPGQVQCSLTDTGPGLDPQARERLFDTFWSTKPEGTGLGLTISRGIIESHGGRLWAEPAAREGAVFCFMLPAAAEDESS